MEADNDFNLLSDIDEMAENIEEKSINSIVEHAQVSSQVFQKFPHESLLFVLFFSKIATLLRNQKNFKSSDRFQ